MSKDVLKLALGALEWITQQRTGGMIQRKATEAITAIKQALEQPVQEPVAIPDDVRKIAKAMQKDGYRGPLSWARTVINFVATYESPPAQPAPVQPVAIRMPKVGDRVVCIEDESLGTVVYLTAGGSPEIKFDDGSHGTYMVREFAELFGYTPTTAQRQWVGLTDEKIKQLADKHLDVGDGERGTQYVFGEIEFARAIEAKLKEKNT